MSDLSATPGFSEWDEFTKSLQSHSVEEVLGIESHGDTQGLYSTGEEKSPTVGVKVEDTMLNFIYSDKICGLEPEEGTSLFSTKPMVAWPVVPLEDILQPMFLDLSCPTESEPSDGNTEERKPEPTV
ncbi:uncharacterized protein LOC143226632 isoform X2 [Tachypleus tridentatus]|uniref:uncharacterized protein LOC143226620 isoform X2 n=1 Tax=Tachypleus tridentatus TaxID=6853 RepID=UPI003FD6052E